MGIEKVIKKIWAQTYARGLSIVPFVPRDKEIKIPWTENKVIYRTGKHSLRKKHPLAANLILSAAYLLTPFISLGIVDEAVNTVGLYKAGQHKLQYSTNAPRYLELDRRAAETGKLDIAIYNVNFGDDGDSHYNRKNIEDYLNTAFKPLGLRVNVTYQDVNVNQEWEARMREVFTDEEMQTSKRQELLERFPAEFREFIRSTQISKPLEKQNPKFSIAGKGGTFEPQLITHSYLADIVGRENYFELPLEVKSNQKLGPRADIGIVIADFRDSGASGVAHNYSDSVVGESYVLIDKKRSNGKPISQKAMNALIAHESGHKIGLNHSSYWPLDVMSYAPISRWIIQKFPQLGIGPESWLEWRKIKSQYDTKKEPGFQEPQPTSLQRLGTSRDFEFYRKHGYDRNPPKVLAMRG
jgi:hypothetical protein